MNYKKVILGFIALATAASTYAVPAKRGYRVIEQSDGTKITVQLIGDEHRHTYITTDGLALQESGDGNLYYRSANGISTVKAHDPAHRSVAEKEFVANPVNVISGNQFMEHSDSRNEVSSRKMTPAMKIGSGNEFTIGKKRIPVILVQYRDVKFSSSDPLKIFEEYFNGNEVSGRKYFFDQSNGKFDPEFDLYGPYTLPEYRSSYGGNDSRGNDVGVGKMVGQACIGMDQEIDFSKYDNNGDGECEVVIVLYAGVGEASSEVASSVWPCCWTLKDSDYDKTLTLDGKTINQFGVFNEFNENANKVDGIGVFCHEFSHCLGLPDFYPTNGTNYFGMGAWSLMDYGCYNDDGYLPIGYSAYEKEFMGWLNIEEATPDTYYTLPVFNAKNEATDKAVRLTNDRDKNEYYLIENRAQQGWDKYLPAEGLLIYHVTYNATSWNNNSVNNYSMQRMTPVPADNSLNTSQYYEDYFEGMKGDLWPYNGNNALTDSSKPAAKVNTGSYLGKPVTEMTRNSEGTISFWVMKGVKTDISAPVMSEHQIGSTTSFTANWHPVTDTEVTYTLEVKEHGAPVSGLISSTIFNTDEHGWSCDGYTVIENGAIRLGSAQKQGSVASPLFPVGPDGKISVVINSKMYSSDGSSVKVSLVDENGTTMASKIESLSNEFKDYILTFDCTPYAKVGIKIETTVKKKRVIVSKADIYNGVVSLSLPSVRASEEVLKFDGITDTFYEVEGLKENGVYDYRVKAVPVNKDKYNESAWTTYKSVDLSAAGNQSGVTDFETEEEASPAELYNLQGMRITGIPAPGIYIIRRGGKTSKIIVR